MPMDEHCPFASPVLIEDGSTVRSASVSGAVEDFRRGQSRPAALSPFDQESTKPFGKLAPALRPLARLPGAAAGRVGIDHLCLGPWPRWTPGGEFATPQACRGYLANPATRFRLIRTNSGCILTFVRVLCP